MTFTMKKIIPAVLVLMTLSFAVVAADQIRIRPDAPGEYVVVDGDTLWDISGRFLEDPWLWPEVWELNPQIENPNLIYPGDIISLEYSPDGPVLTLRRAGASGGLRTVKLSPQVRRESLSAIPAIPLDRINSFLSGNIVLPATDVDNPPYLLGSKAEKLFASENDQVFAKGNWDDSIVEYDIIRAGMNYVDPESGLVVGREGRRIGRASMIDRDGNNATLVLSGLEEEARVGDLFIPSAGSRIDSTYFPEPPGFNLSARILDISSGRSIGNLYDTLVINKGSADRLEVGDLVALQKPDIVVEDTVEKVTIGERFKRALGFSNSNVETFSGDIYASVLIYRVFQNTSLGIVISADGPVRLEDKVVTP